MNRAARSLLVGSVAWLASGCISGRALSGYPGYPFMAFSVPQTADSAFFALQTALRDEGYAIDFTDRATGLINTRPGADPANTVFLSAVIGATGDGAGSDVWIAGYERTGGTSRRVSPLDEDLWPDVQSASARISRRMGGSP
ncbi:MAG: hypothetical protein Q8W46_04050, partial [Candidatus Palauibacterales bacterium]|nr:hypothetical protein [Candidatus Palauibacterales bacterium]